MNNRPEERRGFVRVPFTSEVVITAKGGTIRSSGGFDVSMSGLSLPVRGLALPAGTSCGVKIVLAASPHPLAIEAKGTVVRSISGNLAIRFEGIDLDGYHHLRQLILSNTGDPERAEREFRAHRGIRRP